jgi:hypothetical protein
MKNPGELFLKLSFLEIQFLSGFNLILQIPQNKIIY